MTPLCRITDIPGSGLLPVTVDGLPDLLVCRFGDEVHVVANLCSHGASELSDGRLIGCEVECELHRGRFDVRTGKATRRPAKKPIATYPVQVEEGVVLLADHAAEARMDPRPARH
ncbi:non-heme iron oxygenase ferredoxin subunit [Pseudonocardia acidicola]|uniref:Non-heme iron oxygenase ferredoxin subunit n=1 Tax=Pseudonocardia acidicola TaxID=2724939 RepID=A0ABX1SLG6_9PSEU|nr:non-heme iron oxygenase ferredoxin subunit [Pseudonocardia acidicola]NMI00994.1 non-heme iron oxygenase ferredoxin subunit [Pseudonocardia acidicola]